jgi:serine/threonine protein kinase, bacterial
VQGYLFTLAGGSGGAGFVDGAFDASAFDSPHDVAVSADGTVYVADTGNNCIRAVDAATGVVTTIAGNGALGSADGPLLTSTFSGPTGLAVGYTGAGVLLYVADRGNHRVRLVDVGAGVVSCYAGR